MKIVFFYNLRRLDIESQAEYDSESTIRNILNALQTIEGARVASLDVTGAGPEDIAVFLRVTQPDVVFSTVAGSRGRMREAVLPLLLETMGIPYVGSDAHTMTVTADKHLTKVCASSIGAPTPGWELVTEPLTYMPRLPPVILKPNYEGSSKGIDVSNVHGYEGPRLTEHSAQLLRDYPEGLLVESYVPGFDVTVPILLDRPLGVCALEMVGVDNAVYSYDLKHKNPDAVRVIYPATPDFLTRGQEEQIMVWSQRFCDLFRIKDLGRIDFRVAWGGAERPGGKIFLLEVNALPALDPDVSLFHLAEKTLGLSYNDVFRSLVMAAINRGPRHTAL